MQQDTEVKSGAAILVCALALGLTLFLYNRFTRKKMDDFGVFVLAKITHREKAKNGTDYSLSYFFNKEAYFTKFSSIPNEFLNKDSLVFLKVIPNNPLEFVYVETRVPTCLTLKDSPSDGWKALPTCK